MTSTLLFIFAQNHYSIQHPQYHILITNLDILPDGAVNNAANCKMLQKNILINNKKQKKKTNQQKPTNRIILKIYNFSYFYNARKIERQLDNFKSVSKHPWIAAWVRGREWLVCFWLACWLWVGESRSSRSFGAEVFFFRGVDQLSCERTKRHDRCEMKQTVVMPRWVGANWAGRIVIVSDSQ